MREGVRPVADTAFLSGGGKMGRLMRATDWSATPLGAVASWPQSLRSTLSVVLNSPMLGTILWGPDLRMLYNDAYLPSMLDRHPAALGAPVADVWGDAWKAVAPFFMEVLRTGCGTIQKNVELPVLRDGQLVATFWDFTVAPIVGEDGSIVGLLNQGAETTDRFLAEGRQRLRMALADDMRTGEEPDVLMQAVVDRVAGHFGACRVGFSEASTDGETLLFRACFARGVAPILGAVPMATFGAGNIERQRAGKTLVLEDASGDTENGDTWASLGVGAVLSVPLVREGVFRASLYVNMRAPHAWTAEDVALVEEIGARAWDHLYRLRAEIELREAKETLEVEFANAQRLLAAQGKAEQQQRILQRELSHRMKNTLAMVQSIVSQSLRHATSLEDLAGVATARIQALGRAQDMLTETNWEVAGIRAVIEAAIEPHLDGGDRFILAGPPIDLTAQQSMGLSLAIHELSTNATKYGALSNETGQVQMEWSLGPERAFRFEWTETGGPPVLPPTRKGFGSRLTERVVPSYFAGRAKIDHATEGTRFRLDGTL